MLLQLTRAGADVRVTATGDGADWALAQAPFLLGVDDHPELFTPDHAQLADLLRRRDVRVGGTDLLAEALATAILEQKVTGAEAFTAIRRLVRRFGTPAPGAEDEVHPAHGMYASPPAGVWAAIPSWEYLQAGVEERRSATIRQVMSRIGALERLLARHGADTLTIRAQALEDALRALSGIGPWTAAKVRQQVLGDPDAWSVDDYHVPTVIGMRLGGEAAEVLEPFRPHRFRVELLLMSLGMPERHGPRRSLPNHLPVRGGWRGSGGRHGR